MADADDGMDRATIERNLAQVERDLRAASEDIAYQQETLRNLVRHGEVSTAAGARSAYWSTPIPPVGHQSI